MALNSMCAMACSSAARPSVVKGERVQRPHGGRRDAEPLRVHRVLLQGGGLHRLEGADPDLERQLVGGHPGAGQGLQQAGGEVQAGGGRRHARVTVSAGEEGLVPAAVRAVVRPLSRMEIAPGLEDVGRQRRPAGVRHHRLGSGSAGEAEPPALAGAFEQGDGVARGAAIRRKELQFLTGVEAGGVPEEGVPGAAVRAGRHNVREEPLRLAAVADPAGLEAGRHHGGPVHHHGVARAEVLRQIRHPPMLHPLHGARPRRSRPQVHHEHPRLVPRLHRVGGDAGLVQRVIQL